MLRSVGVDILLSKDFHEGTKLFSKMVSYFTRVLFFSVRRRINCFLNLNAVRTAYYVSCLQLHFYCCCVSAQRDDFVFVPSEQDSSFGGDAEAKKRCNEFGLYP